MNKLKIGIPTGSMVDPVRGGLRELLEKARIYIDNIGTNKPLNSRNIYWLEPRTGKSQEIPAMAAKGYCDIFFAGDDWAKEWDLRGVKSEKLLGLGIGKTDLIIAEGPIYSCNITKVASEYPFLAREAVFNDSNVPIISLADPIPEKGKVVISSFGSTEPKAYYGLANLIVEVSQSGESIKNYKLKLLETVMSSECSLYATEKALEDKWKAEKIDRIKLILEGSLRSQEKDLITFNAANNDLERILNYVRTNGLRGDEETVVKGNRYSEITIEVPTTDKENPLIDILADLKSLGAKSIEGVPLSYSIR